MTAQASHEFMTGVPRRPIAPVPRRLLAAGSLRVFAPLPHWLLAAAFLFLAFIPANLSAQYLKGTVLDQDDGSGISGVSVRLLDSRGVTAKGVLTDDEGGFFLEAPWTGRFTVQCERIGYGTISTEEFDLVPPDTLVVELGMSVEAVVLDPLTVVSDRELRVIDPKLARWGYYDRVWQFKVTGTGRAYFMDYEDIKKRNPGRATDMLTSLSEVRVVQTGRRGYAVRTSRPDLNQRLKTDSGNWLEVAGINNENRGCDMTFYLDGIRIHLDEEESLNDYVFPEHLAAIEVYPRATYPAEYAPYRGQCGSVVVWTGFVKGKGL